MGQVIVITAGKGGVGKVEVTVNLGTALAQLGNNIVLVDADIGLRNLDVAMGLENRIVYDLVDVIEGNARLRQALIKDKRVDNLYLLAAAQTREKNVTPEQLRALTQQLAQEFDFVLLDCPAGIEDGFKNAIADAQKAIIVCTSEVSSVRDAARVIGLWDAQAEDKGPALLIINHFRPNKVTRGEMIEIDDMLEMLDVDLLGIVPEDEHIIELTKRGEPVVYHKQSRAGQAYENISRRLMGEQIPIMKMEPDTPWWHRLIRMLGTDR